VPEQTPQPQAVAVHPDVAAYLINQLTQANAALSQQNMELQARLAELEAGVPDQEPDLAGAAVQG
jgi:cell division protein FtsB